MGEAPAKRSDQRGSSFELTVLMNQSLLISTAERWKIPRALAIEIIARDTACIYCRSVFEDPIASRATCPSWEHIVNDLSIVNIENIGLCCVSCNASKGTKPLKKWLKSNYCVARQITSQSMADIAIRALLTAD
jgi:hypothetical protein